MTLEEAKAKVKAAGKAKKAKGTFEVPGGKKSVFLPKGKEFTKQGEYDTPDKVSKAIAASIGYKNLGAAEMKKRQMAGRKKGRKEAVEELIARMQEKNAAKKKAKGTFEVPGGKKSVFLPKGKEFTKQGEYDTPDKVAKAIAASIGYKNLGAAEMKKRQMAGKKGGKSKKEAAFETAGNMIELVAQGQDPFEAIEESLSFPFSQEE